MAPESNRSMSFYSEARVDGLEQRVETPTQMTEHFINRDDFLVYRHVEFDGRQKKFGPAETAVQRPIMVCSRRLRHVSTVTSHRSTQPCISPGSLNRIPATAGGKGGILTSAGWQVTLCDPIWHVSVCDKPLWE